MVVGAQLVDDSQDHGGSDALEAHRTISAAIVVLSDP